MSATSLTIPKARKTAASIVRLLGSDEVPDPAAVRLAITAILELSYLVKELRWEAIEAKYAEPSA